MFVSCFNMHYAQITRMYKNVKANIPKVPLQYSLYTIKSIVFFCLKEPYYTELWFSRRTDEELML